jgi:hypothetical protein
MIGFVGTSLKSQLIFLRTASSCVYTMNIYDYYSQRNNNLNLFIYIALHVSTSNRSSSGAANFLHTVTNVNAAVW